MVKTKETVDKVLGDRERAQVREGPSEQVFPKSGGILSAWCMA